MNDMGHQYCKLEPQSASNIELAMEGEGALSATTAVTTRKRPSDFALWKKSKPGEPYWESPWGRVGGVVVGVVCVCARVYWIVLYGCSECGALAWCGSCFLLLPPPPTI